MANPIVPTLVAVALDSSGVAGSQVIAINRTNGEKQIKPTDSNKVVIFDLNDFTSRFSANDPIDFMNIGGSVGRGTVTPTSTTGGLNTLTITTAAAPTVAINL